MNKYFNSGNISFVGLNRLTNSIKTLQEKLVVDSCDQASGETMPLNKISNKVTTRGKGKIGKITEFIEENQGNNVSDFDSGSDSDSSMDVSEDEANTSDDEFIDVS